MCANTLRSFFDAVDKLRDMEVQVNPDVLAIALLYSLPSSFDNFRVAIESRHELPDPDALRVKIIEEHDARRNEHASAAMYVKGKHAQQKKPSAKVNNPGKDDIPQKTKKSRVRCNKCKPFGHKATQCHNKDENPNDASSNAVEPVSLCASEAMIAKTAAFARGWCLDSGATSHLCNDAKRLSNANFSRRGKLNLANELSTTSTAVGTAGIAADVFGSIRNVAITDALYVPDLRTNLLSVGKITERGYTVTFDVNSATVSDSDGNVVLIADKTDGLYFVRERHESAQLHPKHLRRVIANPRYRGTGDSDI